MSDPRIIVVGSYVRDLVFRCADFPRPGETVVGQSMSAHGGKGSNQAVAAVRSGGHVAFIGGIGDDAFGREARAFHAAESIAGCAVVKPGQSTGVAGIVVNAQGQNQIVVALNANEALTPADIDAHADAIRNARAVVVQLEANLAAAARALRRARSSRAVTILNPAPMRADFDPAMLADVDILIPNETEFAALVNLLPATRTMVGGDGFDEATLAALSEADLHALCRRFPVPVVIITLGSRGCFLSQPGEGIFLRPAPVGQVVDTTGAGDAFVGAFAAAFVEFGPAEIVDAARFANAAAGISITRTGAAPAMPSRAEIDAVAFPAR